MNGARDAEPRLETLRRRAQFLEAARGRKVVTPLFVLQSSKRRDADPIPTIGVGYTATRRLGKAVARNRAKRRLREVARRVLPEQGRTGRNYVLIARQAILTCPFGELERHLRTALRRIEARPRDRGPSPPRSSG